jgi:hypothetical protein
MTTHRPDALGRLVHRAARKVASLFTGKRPRRAGRSGSPKRATIIRDAEARFEAAREKYDPKRFKRGGGYKPEEYAAIARMAGLKKPPSNRAKGKTELYEFMAYPPGQLFAYYKGDANVGDAITTFMGDVLGHVVWRGTVTKPLGGRRVAIRMKGKNGFVYGGNCNLSSGTYCRLKMLSNQKRP